VLRFWATVLAGPGRLRLRAEGEDTSKSQLIGVFLEKV
jgi:hypothetical protein